MRNSQFKFIYIILFFLFAPTLLFSQKIKVTGIVTQSGNGTPIPYSSVSLTNTNNETLVFGQLTDNKGKFTLEVPPGEYNITVDQAGYESYFDQKNLFVNTFLGKLSMEPSGNVKDIDAIVIQGTKPIYKVELDKKVYDVSQDLTAKTGTLSDVMQNVPSVSVDVEGTVSLRGNENVKILIDGKPSAMLGINDTAEALKSISAAMVDKIEVVTNASARYEASGTAGIINIITKKNVKKGLTGNFQVLGGTPQLYGTNVNLGYGKEKWNWFANAGFRYGKNNGNVKNQYTGYDTNGLQDEYSEQNSKRNRERTSFNANTGFNFDFDKNNSLSTSIGYKYNISNYLSTTYYNNTYFPSLLQTFSERKERQNRNNYGIDGNLNFTHKFSKKNNTLTVDGTFNYSVDNSDSNIFDNKLGKNKNNNTQTGFMLKSDYVLPFKEGSQLEAGVRTDFSKIKTDFSLDELTSGNTHWINNPEYTDKTNYEENILSAYLQYGNKWGNFSFLAGLREETSFIIVQSEKSQSDTHKNYTDLFPTLHLNYDVTEKSQIQLSYSRRINRPKSRMLVSYKNLSDDKNTFSGNPDLDPSYTNSFELGYNIQYRVWGITPSIYYQRTEDPFQKVTISDPLGNLNTSPINLGHENRYGGELSYTINPYKWWRIFGDVNLFQYKNYGSHTYQKLDPITQTSTSITENLNKSGFTWQTRLNMTVKFPENFNFQLQGNYMAPNKSGQNKNKETFGMDLGLSKDILKGQGTILFNIQDVFKSRKRKTDTWGADFYRYSEMQWRPRQFTISFTYRINKENAKKGKKNRQENSIGNSLDDDMGM